MFRGSYAIIRESVNLCFRENYPGPTGKFVYNSYKARINALPDDGVTAPKRVGAVLM
jgi:hypothetical protein